MADEPLLGIPDLVELLASSERHVRRLVAERRIPYIKVGGKVRFDPADVRSYLKRNKVTAAS